MDFHGLAYLNKFGYLAELSYYDNGYTYGQYGTVEGTLIPASCPFHPEKRRRQRLVR